MFVPPPSLFAAPILFLPSFLPSPLHPLLPSIPLPSHPDPNTPLGINPHLQFHHNPLRRSPSRRITLRRPNPPKRPQPHRPRRQPRRHLPTSPTQLVRHRHCLRGVLRRWHVPGLQRQRPCARDGVCRPDGRIREDCLFLDVFVSEKVFSRRGRKGGAAVVVW
jgi:hypothetical protein